MADAFPLSGQIDPKAFPFLVVHLHRGGATGSLKVEGPSYHKALYFRTGRVLFGSSNDPRDQLGSILIEAGKITPEQLEDVNAKVGPGNPLAKVLSDTGFVSQRELSEAARAKVERILSDVLAYTTGSFDFEDGVLPKGAVDLKLSTERLIMSAVRRVADRNFVLRHIDGLDAVLGPTAEMVPRLGEVEGEAGGLPQQLDGRRTLKEAAAQTRLDEFEAAKIACGLLFLGLVEKVHVGVTAAAAEPMMFGAEAGEGGELDLGSMAAQAFTPSSADAGPAAAPAPPAPEAPKAEAPPRPDDDDEPPFVVTADPATYAPPPEPAAPPPAAESPAFVFAEPEAEPPRAAEPAADLGGAGGEIAFAPDSVATSVLPAPEPMVEPAPPPVTAPPASVPEAPPAPAPPAAAPVVPPPAVTASGTSLPLIMPEPRTTSRRPSKPASTPGPEITPPRASRPSKEDLAALDELLNAKGVEGPLTPLEKPGTRGVISPAPRGRGGRPSVGKGTWSFTAEPRPRSRTPKARTG